MRRAPKRPFSSFKPRDPRVRIRQSTVEDDWLAFEEQFGPADWMSDEDFLRAFKIIASRCSIRGEPMRVPPEAVFRIYEKDLDRCGRNRERSLADRAAIAQTRRLLKRERRQKPKNRPRKSWWLKRQACMAVGELWRRMHELVDKEGMSRGKAIQKAAKEIAPGVPIGRARSVNPRLSLVGSIIRAAGASCCDVRGFANGVAP